MNTAYDNLLASLLDASMKIILANGLADQTADLVEMDLKCAFEKVMADIHEQCEKDSEESEFMDDVCMLYEEDSDDSKGEEDEPPQKRSRQ